jgi:hypothetical protein
MLRDMLRGGTGGRAYAYSAVLSVAPSVETITVAEVDLAPVPAAAAVASSASFVRFVRIASSAVASVG